MSRPQFTISKRERTQGGSLPTSRVEYLRDVLLRGGFVVLPSDTCYSLGALATGERARHDVNAVLDRKLGPVSLAFCNFPRVQQYVEVDERVELLLKRFTPGPITVVCKARETVPDHFLENTVGSTDRTIGVRIPDSRIERDIAGSTQHLLMTVAVRDLETGEAVQNFERATAIVRAGFEKSGAGVWAAVEGDTPFLAAHSTVIRVSRAGEADLLRRGEAGPTEEILEYVKNTLGWSVRDLTPGAGQGVS